MEPKLCLAPIQGITDHRYRIVFFKHFKGFDGAMTPFIETSNNHKLQGAASRNFSPGECNGITIIPQLLGKDPDDFLSVAAMLFDLGYHRINWNLGCPYPMVVKKGKGAGLLPYPARIQSFLDRVMPAMQSRLSIKLRLGLEHTDDIEALLPIFNQYPLYEIIIHARTAKQMYRGAVDLDAFARCLDRSRHPVMYNGDIVSAESFERLAFRFPAIGSWMIGRGALCNPFLGEDIVGNAPASEAERPARLRAFHDDLFAAYEQALSGPAHLMDKMKEIWGYLGDWFGGPAGPVKRIKKAGTMAAYLQAVDRLFHGQHERDD